MALQAYLSDILFNIVTQCGYFNWYVSRSFLQIQFKNKPGLEGWGGRRRRLQGEARPGRGALFRAEVYIRNGISRV